MAGALDRYLAAVDVFEDAWAVVVALLLIAGARAPSLVADLLVIWTWFKFGLLALVILASIRQLFGGGRMRMLAGGTVRSGSAPTRSGSRC